MFLLTDSFPQFVLVALISWFPMSYMLLRVWGKPDDIAPIVFSVCCAGILALTWPISIPGIVITTILWWMNRR